MPAIVRETRLGDRPAVRGSHAAVLPDGEGELISINVLPAYHGSGVERELWDEVVAALRQRGCAGRQIWVVAKNARAIRLLRKTRQRRLQVGHGLPRGVAAKSVGYRFTFPTR